MGSLTGFDKGLKRFHEDRAGHLAIVVAVSLRGDTG